MHASSGAPPPPEPPGAHPPVDLVALAGDLRGRGYGVGVEQVILAERLLRGLASAGGPHPAPERLATALGAVFCRSAEEQRGFPEIFARHLLRDEPPVPPVPPLPPGPDGRDAPRLLPLPRDLAHVWPWLRSLSRPQQATLVLLVMIVTPVVALSAYEFQSALREFLRPALSGKQVPIGGGPAPPPAVEVDWRAILSNVGMDVGLAVAIMLVGAAARAAFLWWRRRSRLFLSRRLYRERQRVSVARVRHAGRPVYPEAAVRKAARALAAHRAEPSAELDARATVERTIANAGAFTPVPALRRVQPEYVALLDRLGGWDQQARLVEELLLRLKDERLHASHYFFSGDPGVCHSGDPREGPLSLDDLFARHPSATLLLFSDGRGLTSPLTGRLAEWVGGLEKWKRRIVVLLGAADAHREALLREAGVEVARLDGFADTVRALNQGEEGGRPAAAAPYPRSLLETAARWLDRVPPDEDTVEELRVELFRYLGERRYTLLCTCAIYPELDFDLTLYLADALFGGAEDARELQPLLALPWFRAGYIPDWLREFLIAELLPSEERRAREALERLLRTALGPRGEGGFALGAVVHPRAGSPRDEAADPDAGRTLRLYDHVTLSFLAASQRLSVSAPPEALQAFAAPAEGPLLRRRGWELLAGGWVVLWGALVLLVGAGRVETLTLFALCTAIAALGIWPLRQLRAEAPAAAEPAGGTARRRAPRPERDVVREIGLEPAAPPAWVVETLGAPTGRGVRVGVVGSGFDRSIADPRVLPGVSFVDPADDLGVRRSDDDHDRIGQGTACAGLVLRAAPDARVVPIRIFGGGLTTSTSVLLAALEWATKQRLGVVVVAAGTSEPEALRPLYAACERARRGGVIIVAGESPETPEGYPSVFENVIGVAAGRFPSPFLYRYRPDEASECEAWGEGVPVRGPGERPAARRSTGYAAAALAGIVALLLERRPGATLEQVRESLRKFAVGDGVGAAAASPAGDRAPELESTPSPLL